VTAFLTGRDRLGWPVAAHQLASAYELRRAQEAEEMTHWLAFDRLRQYPTEENARAAKRSFFTLAKRYHPDQGGTHYGFLRLKHAYDRTLAAYKAA
ncbi:MAG: hypothetical protein ACP5XB_12120, partial [Isosphaeraceae bacterium]